MFLYLIFTLSLSAYLGLIIILLITQFLFLAHRLHRFQRHYHYHGTTITTALQTNFISQTGPQVHSGYASLTFCQWYLTCHPQYLSGRATKLSSLLLSNPPSPTHTLLFFITHITILGLSHTIIKMYLSVVHIMHVATGQQATYGSRHIPHLQQVLKGIKKNPSYLPTTTN